MNAQLDTSFSALDRLGQRLPPGQARRVGRGVGELTVLAGRVWVTGRGGDDVVLAAGQRLTLAQAEQAVIESFDTGCAARVAWRPRGSLIQRLGLRAQAGTAFAALARRAAPSASRAQGCMP